MAKKQRRSFKQDALAIVYDFDGTLCPKPMQENTVLPKLGIDGKTFWEETVGRGNLRDLNSLPSARTAPAPCGASRRASCTSPPG